MRVYEPSALNRVMATRRPGSTYASGNHDATIEYETNVSNSVRKVREGSTSATLSVSGYYAAGALHCVKTIDEDSVVVRTFTDNLGRTVLERKRFLRTRRRIHTMFTTEQAG